MCCSGTEHAHSAFLWFPYLHKILVALDVVENLHFVAHLLVGTEQRRILLFFLAVGGRSSLLIDGMTPVPADIQGLLHRHGLGKGNARRSTVRSVNSMNARRSTGTLGDSILSDTDKPNTG